MARAIPGASLAKLAQTHGAEPIIMVDIAWVIDKRVKATRYATKYITPHSTVAGTTISIPGKVQEIGEVDSVVAISLNETSEEFSLVLDDTDGSIKSIVDVNDIHLRNVWVYQWFEGLNFEDRFLIFQGKINSPVSWSETDRTVKMSVVSQLEDKDVGFSPEEGAFPDLPEDMVGKVWPECFGTSIHQKAIQVDFKHSGSLGDPVGLRDFTLQELIDAHELIYNDLIFLGLYWALAAGWAKFLGMEKLYEQLIEKSKGFFLQAGQKRIEITELELVLEGQIDTEVGSFRVIGGEHFPRGGLKLIINDAIFSGSFSGTQGEQGADIFHISCADHPETKNFYSKSTPCGNPVCEGGVVREINLAQTTLMNIANRDSCKMWPEAEVFLLHTGNILGETAGPFFAQGGAAVTIYSNEPLRYFVSITPGDVLKVAAFTTFDSGERVLVDVPTNRYRVYTQNYGSVSVKVVEVIDALSKQNPPWEDTLYITFKSSVGPNTISIMAYLINKYADIPFDQASFDECWRAVNNYPMHFCLHKKKNIVTVLKELAFMARLALSIKNGKFFCRYLPAEPPSVFTFTESNVLTQSIELGFTSTEELVTKYLATWRQHGAQDEDNVVIMRYNVKKYGTHQEDVDFYAYNYISALVKSLTFWINRRGHTWKKLTFQAALDALNVETFDGVTLDFSGNYASNSSTLSSVEEANYNPNDNTMDLTVWTGVRAGDMEQYELAYPKGVSTLLRFPDAIATAAGFAGGDGPGNSAAGTIDRRGVKAGSSVSSSNDDPYKDKTRKKQDLGSNKPSDIDDANPGDPIINSSGQVNTGAPPPPTPRINNTLVKESEPINFIDIRTTEISDSDNPGEVTTLDTFFANVTDNILKAKTAAIWTEGSGLDDEEGEFDFKWDEDGEKFGAGTAFLKEEE